jgi:DNA-binding transcriptional LysR family regulator
LRREGALLQAMAAEMQMLNWNDLRYVLAISRGKTLGAAARLLGVDDTTVARRLVAIQDAIGARLYQRLPDGTLQLTTAGERAALHAERIEREVSAIGASVKGADDPVSGIVRVTSVPIIVGHILVPAAQTLLKRHPKLQLELVAEPRDLSLTRREADVALRLARPKTGGTRVLARRVGALGYGVYAPASCSPRDARMLSWVSYDETMAHLPQAAGLRRSRRAAIRKLPPCASTTPKLCLKRCSPAWVDHYCLALSPTATRGCEGSAQAADRRYFPGSCGCSRIRTCGESAGSKPSCSGSGR